MEILLARSVVYYMPILDVFNGKGGIYCPPGTLLPFTFIHRVILEYEREAFIIHRFIEIAEYAREALSISKHW